MKKITDGRGHEYTRNGDTLTIVGQRTYGVPQTLKVSELLQPDDFYTRGIMPMFRFGELWAAGEGDDTAVTDDGQHWFVRVNEVETDEDGEEVDCEELGFYET